MAKRLVFACSFIFTSIIAVGCSKKNSEQATASDCPAELCRVGRIADKEYSTPELERRCSAGKNASLKEELADLKRKVAMLESRDANSLTSLTKRKNDGDAPSLTSMVEAEKKEDPSSYTKCKSIPLNEILKLGKNDILSTSVKNGYVNVRFIYVTIVTGDDSEILCNQKPYYQSPAYDAYIDHEAEDMTFDEVKAAVEKKVSELQQAAIARTTSPFSRGPKIDKSSLPKEGMKLKSTGRRKMHEDTSDDHY